MSKTPANDVKYNIICKQFVSDILFTNLFYYKQQNKLSWPIKENRLCSAFHTKGLMFVSITEQCIWPTDLTVFTT